MITTSHLDDHNDSHNDSHDDSHEYHSSNSSNSSSSSAARCRARDATLLKPLVWFFFPLFFLLFKVYFRSPQHVETSMAAVAATAAWARDVTRLEPLVYFYIYMHILLHSHLFRLIYLRGYRWRRQAESGVAGRADGGSRCIASRAPGLFLLLLCVNVKINKFHHKWSWQGMNWQMRRLGTDASQVRALGMFFGQFEISSSYLRFF